MNIHLSNKQLSGTSVLVQEEMTEPNMMHVPANKMYEYDNADFISSWFKELTVCGARNFLEVVVLFFLLK